MNAPVISFASSDRIVLTFRDATISHGEILRYVAKAGDTVGAGGNVIRDGQAIGRFAGDGREYISLFDGWRAEEAFDFLSQPHRFGDGYATGDLNGSYKVAGGAGAIAVTEVHRKSMVVDTARTADGVKPLVEHTVTLMLQRPVKSGETIRISFAGDDDLDPVSTVYRPTSSIAESIHVSQIGFEPDDPLKVAYVSFWHGRANDGASSDRFETLDGLAGRGFRLIDAKTGAVVDTGKLTLSPPAPGDAGLTKAPVFEADFSDVTRAGTYRLAVDGVGASREIKIGQTVWQDAFETAARGFYHQRSGVALIEAHTDWTRPRSMHPADGNFKVYQTTARLMDTDMGLDLLNQDSFAAVARYATKTAVSDVWGGWHDAGDFDRRAQHLEAARTLMRLVELEPDFARRTNLDIPESGDALPDLLNEALWGIDFFKRLQKADGGVPGGAETAGHPSIFEASWTDTQTLYVWAPDAWSSYEYAAAAARAATLLQRFAPGKAGDYAASAKKAFDWAEKNTPDYAARSADVKDARTLAAAELFRATGDARAHEVFLATSAFAGGSSQRTPEQWEAGVSYALTERAGARQSTQDAVRTLLLRTADGILSEGPGDFGQYRTPGTPYHFQFAAGTPSASADFLVLAHAFSGNRKYLEAIVSDAQFGLGANPMNLSHTTGVGWGDPEAIVHHDAALNDQGPPPGITIWGTSSFGLITGAASLVSQVQKWLKPLRLEEVPAHENFQSHIPKLAEFTVNTSMDATTFVWGYLAANDPGGAAAAGSTTTVVSAALDDGFVFGPGDSTAANPVRIRGFSADDGLDLSALGYGRIVTTVDAYNADPDALLVRQSDGYVMIRHGGWKDGAFHLIVEGSSADVLAALDVGTATLRTATPGTAPAPVEAAGLTRILAGAAQSYDLGADAVVFTVASPAAATRTTGKLLTNFGRDDVVDLSALGFSAVVSSAAGLDDGVLLIRKVAPTKAYLNGDGWGADDFFLEVRGDIGRLEDALIL